MLENNLLFDWFRANMCTPKGKQVKEFHTMKEMATKEEFALAVLLESIETGDIEAAREVLSRIDNLGLELIVRAKADN